MDASHGSEVSSVNAGDLDSASLCQTSYATSVCPRTCSIRSSCLIMRLLERKPNGDLVFREFADNEALTYAILSHTWLLNNNEEVSFQDVEVSTGEKKDRWKKI